MKATVFSAELEPLPSIFGRTSTQLFVNNARVAKAWIAMSIRTAPSISGYWIAFPLQLSRLPLQISPMPLLLRPGGVTPLSRRSRR